MQNKGQTGMQVGLIIIVAITLIVGVILFQAIAQEVGSSTTVQTVSNLSIGIQTNDTTYYLTDYKSFSDVIVTNATGGEIIGSANYTVTNNAIDPTTGSLSVSILPHDPTGIYSGVAWNISATAQPVTYISDSGARSVASLIAIFFALAVAVVALVPSLRSEVLGMMKR